MFERDDQIDEAVDRLFNLMVEIGRGGILPHDAIREVLNVEPHVGRWDHVVNRARNRLQKEHGIATWVRPEDRTVGYRLLTKSEQIYKLPGWRAERSARQIRRARRSVAAIPEAELSENQRKNRNAELRELREAECTVRRANRTIAAIAKGQPMVPRRAVLAGA